MFKTFAPAVAGLSLLLVLPAFADEPSAIVKCPTDAPVIRTVVVKGMLRHVTGELDKIPRVPFEYWELHAPGKTYYLDLRGKGLLDWAEKLVNRPVVVAGFPEPASPTLLVTSLQPDEFIKQTIHVEIRGRLVSIRDQRILEPLEQEPSPAKAQPQFDADLPGWRPFLPRPRDLVVGWRILVGDKAYDLAFDNSPELWKLAENLDGQSMFVTGTRVGDVIQVRTMKADEGSYQETVAVEIQGRLHSPRDVEQQWAPPPLFWTVTAGDKTYRLAFGDNRRLEKLAASLENTTVVVTGTFQHGFVTVTGLRSSDPPEKTHLAEATKSIAGVWDSTWGPVTIECADVEDYGSVPIAGSWVQGPGQVGVIKSGTFDSAKGVLEFAFDEPWHNQSGTAVLSLSADGKKLKGTWKFTTSGGSGSWVMTRR
jgi:hypothetical protein